jgi:hypothetical protein
MREYQVRICERLGVKFPGPTRQSRRFRDAPKESGSPPIADMQRLLRHVRSVAITEIISYYDLTNSPLHSDTRRLFRV